MSMCWFKGKWKKIKIPTLGIYARTTFKNIEYQYIWSLARSIIRNNTHFFKNHHQDVINFKHVYVFSIVFFNDDIIYHKTHTLKNECTCCHTGKRPLISLLPSDTIKEHGKAPK